LHFIKGKKVQDVTFISVLTGPRTLTSSALQSQEDAYDRQEQLKTY